MVMEVLSLKLLRPFSPSPSSSETSEHESSSSSSCSCPSMVFLSRRNAALKVSIMATFACLNHMGGGGVNNKNNSNNVAWALMEEEKQKGEGGGGLLDEMQSLFDPNEKTKSGRVLPKAYLKSAREVVKTLRESLDQDPSNLAQFRRGADMAKSAIFNYIKDWRGSKYISSEDSYKALERALRILGEFYSRKGPTAVLPGEIKTRLLEDLDVADAAL